MKTPLALFAVTLVTALAFTTSPQPTSPVAPRDTRSIEGRIENWCVEDDGTLLLAIRANGGGEPVWLRTPASQSSTTQFELLALNATLALDGALGGDARPAYVRGEGSTEDDGSSPEHPLVLLAVGKSRQP